MFAATPAAKQSVCFGLDTFLEKQFDRLSHILIRIIRCLVLFIFFKKKGKKHREKTQKGKVHTFLTFNTFPAVAHKPVINVPEKLCNNVFFNNGADITEKEIKNFLDLTTLYSG
jgi:hypothetical protein